MKKALIALLLLLLALAGAASWRALRLTVPQEAPATATLLEVDHVGSSARLAQALRFATVSDPDPSKVDLAAFDGFIQHLATSFPLLHQQLSLERINGHALLFRWQGSEPKLAPVLLAAHYDVVPAADEGWAHAPFAGEIDAGLIWGRGTLDDKSSLMAQLEAVEALLAQGYTPRRTVYLAYGHDEEVGGQQGAAAIAEHLRRQGVKLHFTLDEGGAVTRGVVPGIAAPVATIMAGEKGYLTLRLSLQTEGGHSSTPPRTGAIGRLARAVQRLEQNPMPARLTPPVEALFATLAPHMDFGPRMVIANRDWLPGVFFAALAMNRSTDALIRSSTAVTLFRAGERDNQLPAHAEALVNLRLLPGDSIAAAIQHVRETIADPQIAIERWGRDNHEAPPLSDPAAPQFQQLARAVREVFPDALVASGLVLAATDSRHYAGIRQQGYQFSPMPYTAEDAARIHGVGERIALADYQRMVQFYAQLLRAQ